MKKMILFLFIVFFFVSVAYAVIPSMPEKMAVKLANVVVKADAIEVTQKGEAQDRGCMIWTPFEAKLKVLEIYKGQPKAEIILKYDHKTLKQECAGQPFYGPSKGEKKKFYLHCDESMICSVVHEGMIQVEK